MATVMYPAPDVVMVPVATNEVVDSKVVASAEPFHSTRAPATKRSPATVRVNGPTVRRLGLSDAIAGVRCLTVTVQDAERLAFAVLVARTLTLTPGGGTGGAV